MENIRESIKKINVSELVIFYVSIFSTEWFYTWNLPSKGIIWHNDAHLELWMEKWVRNVETDL